MRHIIHALIGYARQLYSCSMLMWNLKALFHPLELGPITLKNRIFMSAMIRNRSMPTSIPNRINAEYYQQRAAGGAGLIVTENILIVPNCATSSQWQNAPGIWSEEQVRRWKKVTDAVHKKGGVIFVQLSHLGRLSHPDAPEQIASGQPVFGPSAIAARGAEFRFLVGRPGYTTPTAIDDPHTLLSQWKQATVHAEEAGFDGVEIHGAYGYLIHQFLDCTSNDRADEWGGSVHNRARLALEVVKIAADIWGPGRVGIKLNPVAGYNDVRMPLQEALDTFRYLITELNRLGIAYVALVRYAESLDSVIDGTRRGTKHDVLGTYAPLLKNHATRVFANASFTCEEAAQYVEDEKVGGVFFGIPWVANPDFAKRLEKGK